MLTCRQGNHFYNNAISLGLWILFLNVATAWRVKEQYFMLVTFFQSHRTHYLQKLHVWAEILRTNVIGHIFIDDTLAAAYLQLLETEIVPAIISCILQRYT